jgi:hypothetical protein
MIECQSPFVKIIMQYLTHLTKGGSMKKVCVVLALAGFVLAGCASYQPMGVVYTRVDAGVTAASGPINYSKVGKAEAQSVLGLVATGDASIQAACKNGNIKNIKYVDYHVENILGVIGKYSITVYGD